MVCKDGPKREFVPIAGHGKIEAGGKLVDSKLRRLNALMMSWC
jgi:hypothetical protein